MAKHMTDREAFERAYRLLVDYFNATTSRTQRHYADRICEELPGLRHHFLNPLEKN
jgi:hypothetical protein